MVSNIIILHFFVIILTDQIDPHEVLGVSKTATDEEIKKEYKNLVRKYHPDICKLPDAPERFNDIKKAYNMIKTEENRLEMQEMEELGDLANEIEGNFDQLQKGERELLTKFLKRIRDEQSILGRLLPTATMVYEISQLRKSKVTYYASSIEQIPQYLSLASFDYWISEKEHKIEFGLFNRGVNQDVVGKLSFDKNKEKMEWVTIDGRIIASAAKTEQLDSFFGYSQKFVVKSRGNTIGHFITTSFHFLPIVSSTDFEVITSANKRVNMHATKICFFGTRFYWSSDTLSIASAVREMVCIFLYYFSFPSNFYYSFNLLVEFLI